MNQAERMQVAIEEVVKMSFGEGATVRWNFNRPDPNVPEVKYEVLRDGQLVKAYGLRGGLGVSEELSLKWIYEFLLEKAIERAEQARSVSRPCATCKRVGVSKVDGVCHDCITAPLIAAEAL